MITIYTCTRMILDWTPSTVQRDRTAWIPAVVNPTVPIDMKNGCHANSCRFPGDTSRASSDIMVATIKPTAVVIEAIISTIWCKMAE